jgi:hypothetical protein
VHTSKVKISVSSMDHTMIGGVHLQNGTTSDGKVHQNVLTMMVVVLVYQRFRMCLIAMVTQRRNRTLPMVVDVRQCNIGMSPLLGMVGTSTYIMGHRRTAVWTTR